MIDWLIDTIFNAAHYVLIVLSTHLFLDDDDDDDDNVAP